MIHFSHGNSKNITADTLAAQRAEAAAKAEYAYQGAQAYLKAMKAQYEHDHKSVDWDGVAGVIDEAGS